MSAPTAADHVAEGISVHAVNPGTVDTTVARGHIAAAPVPAAASALTSASQA